MTGTQTRARARSAGQDWRRHVLALVLFAVLVWYTVVSPSYAAAPLRAAAAEPPDAEEREAEARAAVGPVRARAVAPRPREFGASEEDELDWPEIIGDE